MLFFTAASGIDDAGFARRMHTIPPVYGWRGPLAYRRRLAARQVARPGGFRSLSHDYPGRPFWAGLACGRHRVLPMAQLPSTARGRNPGDLDCGADRDPERTDSNLRQESGPAGGQPACPDGWG